jgi:hypothetical protein
VTMLVVPFRVFGFAACVRMLPPRKHPLGIGCSLRVVDLARYRSYWFHDPTLPLAVPSAVWFFRTRLRWEPFGNQSNPLSSFASL